MSSSEDTLASTIVELVKQVRALVKEVHELTALFTPAAEENQVTEE